MECQSSLQVMQMHQPAVEVQLQVDWCVYEFVFVNRPAEACLSASAAGMVEISMKNDEVTDHVAGREVCVTNNKWW